MWKNGNGFANSFSILEFWCTRVKQITCTLNFSVLLLFDLQTPPSYSIHTFIFTHYHAKAPELVFIDFQIIIIILRALVENSKWKWKCVCSRVCHSKDIAKIIYFEWEENHFYWENLIVILLLVIVDSFHSVRFSRLFRMKKQKCFWW